MIDQTRMQPPPPEDPLQTHESGWRCATSQVLDFVDVTEDLKEAVRRSGVIEGRVTVFSPSDRCPLVVNERESGLLKDIKAAVGRVREANGSSPTTIGAKSVVFPIVQGGIRLGRWQRVLLFELEGPSERDVVVQIVGR